MDRVADDRGDFRDLHASCIRISIRRRRRCSSWRSGSGSPPFNAWYSLGVDGIAMPLILLTTFITPLVVIASWTVIEKKPAQYYASFLILEGLMIGVFAALDALLFYVLWEAMLIPMFIIIGVWGGPRRVYATIKFFLYTFLGSVFMLVSLIYMYLQTCDGRAVQLRDRGLPAPAARHERADRDLHGVPAGVRGEGADVAGAHLAAGCARRGADGRLGHSGGDHAEDGRLWLSALLAADHAGCEQRARLARDLAVAHRGRLHRLRGARAAGHEEADCVFLDRAHGIRHARVVPGVRTDAGQRRCARRRDGHRRRHGADDFAWPDFRRAVLLRRRAL